MSGASLRPPRPTSLAATSAMRGNRRADTAPSCACAPALHRRGYRFRKDFPARGRPSVRVDIVFPGKRLAVFVDGCLAWLPPALPGPGGQRRLLGAEAPGQPRARPPHRPGPGRPGWRVLRIWEHEPLDEAVALVLEALRRMRAVSLFSGAGGMDLGVRQAGFRGASVELDPHCCASLRANAEPGPGCWRRTSGPSAPTRSGTALGLRPGELDLLFGGPPCQPFSQIGKRAGRSTRASLLFELVRFAEAPAQGHLRRAGEGAAGRRSALGRLLEGLRALGYEPTWDVLNAADYGVPQRRQRLILVAERDGGRHRPARPDPRRPPRPIGPSARRWPARPAPAPAAAARPDGSHVDVTPEGQRRRISFVPEGQWLAAQLGAPPEIRQRLTRKDTTKFRRLARSAPSLTLRCGEIFFHPWRTGT